MKILIKITAFVIILLLTSTFIPALAQGNTIGSISASSACLMDADSGKLLYSKNAQKRTPTDTPQRIGGGVIISGTGLFCSGQLVDLLHRILQHQTGIGGGNGAVAVHYQHGSEGLVITVAYVGAFSLVNGEVGTADQMTADGGHSFLFISNRALYLMDSI